MATTRNVPLSIDDELLAEIDKVAEQSKESRSAIMRRAIREGLPVLKSGTGADVITLDSETSADVESGSKDLGISRAKLILEAIRTGLQAAYSSMSIERDLKAQKANHGEDAEKFSDSLLEAMRLQSDPMNREVRYAMRQRGAVLNRFRDLLMHVPQAFERFKLVEKLTQIRRQRGGYALVWGCGLSNSEVRWQIEMDEKYGGGTIPKEVVEAREKARAEEEPARRAHIEEVFQHLPPGYPEV